MPETPATQKTFPVSWDQLHRDSRALAWRLIDTVCIASYDDRGRRAIKVLKTVPGDGAGWLPIDVLVDAGRTAKAVRELLPAAHFATIYAKPAGRPLVDSLITEVSQETWILFHRSRTRAHSGRRPDQPSEMLSMSRMSPSSAAANSRAPGAARPSAARVSPSRKSR